MKPTCKIAILENYTLYGSGIKSLISHSEDLEVIAEEPSPESLALNLHKNAPDIIIIDLLHRNNAGLKTIKQIKGYFPDIPLLLITSNDYADCFKDYIALGARGFVLINEGPKALFDSIKSLCDGKMYLHEDVRSTISFPDKPIRTSILSEREMDVLRLFCNGLTYKEIGKELFISPRTVESHKKNIMAKLNISSTAEMVKYATRNKLLAD